MRQTQIIMGTGVSIDIPDGPKSLFKDVFALLRKIDAQFSPYKSSSELSRYNRHEISNQKLSPVFKHIIQACQDAESLTAGYFSANYDAGFDPSGYVKGWAISEAGKLVKDKGYSTFCIGIGGDILASSDNSKTWGIGITNPRNKKSLTSQVFIKNGGVATSGSYERGAHIINPHTKSHAQELISVTIIGPDIIMADILATACFAAGLEWGEVLNRNKSYEMLAFDNAGQELSTPGYSSFSQTPNQ